MGSLRTRSSSDARLANVFITLVNGTMRMMLRWMILSIIVGVMLSAVTACSSLRYETADGTKVTYTRVLTTADHIKGQVGQAKIEANGQKIDNETLNTILRLLGVAVTP